MHLKEFTSLEFLNVGRLGRNDFTDAAFRELKKALPNCIIQR
jgi:hypothetical protein